VASVGKVRNDRRVAHRDFGVSLGDLIASGYLSKDQALFANQKGKRWGARLTAGGKVVLDGEREALSLSAAARRICGHQANGWQVWLVDRDGHKCSLRRIREAYLEDQR
jgi:hypothetical protein